MNLTEERLQYLELLSQKFPSPAQVSTEIINLNAILGLPKGSEHFISDIHGEYRLFLHILKNASGSVRRKIFQCFTEEEMPPAEVDALATLIYYPEEKLALLKEENGPLSTEWYTATLLHLVQVCRKATSKYTRSKVRKAMPRDFAYIIDELLNYSEADEDDNRTTYVHNIVRNIIEVGSADAFIIAISELIQHAVIDKLHIVGDIFDRGNGAHKVMDALTQYNNVDIQWGNHDILWMAAALGQWASIANVLRNCIRYNNFDSLEDGYGINLRPLTQFALATYRDDPCTLFLPSHSKRETELKQRRENDDLTAKVHKAISVIQFKLEGQILRDHPEYHMSHRLFWETVDAKTHRVQIDNHWYDLKDSHFPTLSPDDPYRLSPAEETVMNDLAFSFRNSIRLQRHLKYLLDNGSIYKLNNGYLLYHGCIPMNEDGSLHYSTINGKKYAGRAMLDEYNRIVRIASYAPRHSIQRKNALDLMWYLWCGTHSPLSGKYKIATFERYFIADDTAGKEEKDPYYKWIEQEETAVRILTEFGADPVHGKIITGHVPVKAGESPIKANGRVINIDGGMNERLNSVTGGSGYTLVSNSHQLLLAQHHPINISKSMRKNEDIHSELMVVEKYPTRQLIRDIDDGKVIARRVADLQELLAAYRSGVISPKE